MKYLLKIVPFLLAFTLGAIVFYSKTPEAREGCIQQIPNKAINYAVVNYVPVINKDIRYEKNIIHDTIPNNIDSLAVISDYFAKRFYIDTIVNDTNAFIVVKDTVFRNRLASRSLQMKVFPHLYTIQQPINRKLFLGGGIIAYPNKIGMLAGGIYIDKKERAFAIMFDPIGHGVFLSAYWKIRLKKK